MVPLIALRDLPYVCGRRVAKGETFTVSPEDARILKLGRLAKDAPKRLQSHPDDSTDVEKPKRTYRRRDLTADPE